MTSRVTSLARRRRSRNVFSHYASEVISSLLAESLFRPLHARFFQSNKVPTLGADADGTGAGANDKGDSISVGANKKLFDRLAQTETNKRPFDADAVIPMCILSDPEPIYISFFT